MVFAFLRDSSFHLIAAFVLLLSVGELEGATSSFHDPEWNSFSQGDTGELLSGEIMFRCQLCSSVVPAGTRSTKIILKTRGKTYGERGSNPAARGGFGRRGKKPAPKKEFDKGGAGQEIVREAMVCPKCAADHQRQLEQESLEQESLNTNEGAE